MDLSVIVAQAVPLAWDVGMAILMLAIGWVCSKWFARLTLSSLTRSHIDAAVAGFLSNIVQYSVLAAAVIAALGAVGIETTSLVAILGSAGLAVGLALQGSLSNFAAGVMILFFRPFQLGDAVTTAGHTGKVVDIGLFATSLHTPDNHKIIIPNSAITGGSIVNLTTLGTRRGSVAVGVAYGSDIPTIVRILTEAAASVEVVHDEPAPAVAFTGMGASSLDFTVLTWSDAPDYLTMLHEVRAACYDALNREGIDIPYDQVVVHNATAVAAAAK